MPAFSASAISIVNQIKSNLQDRYDSGYPILKELLQNADDAKAQRFALDALPGWTDAANPLLQGPGLLIANDGRFREEDERGITSFGESGKTDDSAAIGKFGFGQKAVFHLCDAFVVYAQRGEERSFSTVVNPFLDVEIDGNICQRWEPAGDGGLDPTDLERLSRAAPTHFPKQRLLLWLPFRRDEILPAPGMSFSTKRPTIQKTLDQLARPDDLRMLLAALRHLTSIEILEQGDIRCALAIDTSSGRLIGPVDQGDGVRPFGGTIRDNRATEARFVGREAMVRDGRLARLKSDPHWPRTISVFRSTPQPEKGEPHGAAILTRVPGDAADQPGELRISWAVFLPVSDNSDIVIPLQKSAGRFRLLLHGYFFLDSGRRRIEGVDARTAQGALGDVSALHWAWNAELRDAAVLPRLPALLRDALDAKMLTSAELAQLVSAIAHHALFQDHRAAVGAEHSLAQVIEAPSAVVWRLTPSGTKLRPLPASSTPKGIEQLFQGVGEWARANDARLVVDATAALSAEPLRWPREDLDQVFAGLSPRAFQLRDLATLLAEVLQLVSRGPDGSGGVGPHLVATLRRAMVETATLAPAESIRLVFADIGYGLLLPLPASVEHRQVLRALADAPSEILPVRAEWVGGDVPSPRLSRSDLVALLKALEPLIEGEQADQAATAALALLSRADHGLPHLALDPEFSSIKVLRARAAGGSEPVALSVQALVERSQAGSLFAASPQANAIAPALVNALLDVEILFVEGKTAELLREASSLPIRLCGTAGESLKDAILALINATSRFGTGVARLGLLQRLRPTEQDDRPALRRLCAGEQAAGSSFAHLWRLEGAAGGLERVLGAVLRQSESDFLIPTQITGELSLNLARHVGIVLLDAAAMGTLLERDSEIVAGLALTQSECEALLSSPLNDTLLRRLRIHEGPDGARIEAFNAFREAGWRVPAALKPLVRTVRLYPTPQARERQEQLIEAWSPREQIKVALDQPEPHRFWREILDALAQLHLVPDGPLRSALGVTRWLVAEEGLVAPRDVLNLSRSVDEAARTLLQNRGEPPPFLPAQALPIEVREHAGFAQLSDWILPDEATSFEALALMIEGRGIVGLLGAPEDYPIEDFTILAGDDRDLGLPGWPLLAAALIALRDRRDQAAQVVRAFASLNSSETNRAASHLDGLAALAHENGKKGHAARRAYRHCFGVVAQWSEDARCGVFAETRVPTRSGAWRSGRVVAQDCDGLDPGQVLSGDHASLFPRGDAPAAVAPDSGDAPAAHFGARRPPEAYTVVDMADLDARSASQHGNFLEAWRGRVPSDLAIVYLGLIGRSPPFRRLAESWEGDATVDVDTFWQALDDHFPRDVLYPNSLAEEVNQRRFLIEPVRGQHVRAIALSGDLFEAAVGGADQRLLIGNRHTKPEGIRCSATTVSHDLFTLSVRRVDAQRVGLKEAGALFREFVDTIAADCLWLRSEGQQAALRTVLDQAIQVDQATIEETERLLCDRLPTILAELKLPTDSRSQMALRDYQEEESRLHHRASPAEEIPTLLSKRKQELWHAVAEGGAASELLAAVRAKIRDYGYSAGRVLFELLQNADDAYRQTEKSGAEACFRVEALSDDHGGFRVIHWGRPINYLGLHAAEGRRLGRDRDLLNMLLMNFSEKRPADDLTGKFGLGFKSVHVLSDSVGIASGFVALHTLGGFLPARWDEGVAASESRKRPDGRKATVIEVPFSEEAADEGLEAIASFRTAATWAPAFARVIRRIEIDDRDEVSISCRLAPLMGSEAIQIVSTSGLGKERALRFDLGGGFSLLLRLDATGPCPFPRDLGRLWNLAPLEEDMRSDWLLNGPFAVDPGRTGLAGSLEERQEKFRALGRALGKGLLELHGRAETDWPAFAEALGTDASGEARLIFWARLFDVLAPDFDDSLARHLHTDRRGYGHLAGECEVVPARLPSPFDGLVQGSQVRHYAAGALSNAEVLRALHDWPALAALRGRMVSSEVMGQLAKLGFGGVRPLRFSDLLRSQLGDERRVDAKLAERLSRAITRQAIRAAPFNEEREDVLGAVAQSLFLAQDGAWRIAQLPPVEAAEDDEERLLCEFAPARHLLDPGYTGSSIEFFRVARQRSGFGPQARDFAEWMTAMAAGDLDRQRAALRYVVEGRQGGPLADILVEGRPEWLPGNADDLRASPLVDEIAPETLPLLLGLLYPAENLRRWMIDLGSGPGEPEPQPPREPADPTDYLEGLYAWWVQAAEAERTRADAGAYPDGFHPTDLPAEVEGEGRVGWFTFFALAIFRTIGRTHDSQHRNFIDAAFRAGWWAEMATASLPNDPAPWIGRLEDFARADVWRINFPQWRRAMADLYALARWLPDYVDALRALPTVVRREGLIALSDAWRLSASPLWQRRGLEGAPLTQSLGPGANWLAREAARHGVWTGDDAAIMQPYGWASTARLRTLFSETLGFDLGSESNMDLSPNIYAFVRNHLGERATFLGDLDLPLQIATRGPREAFAVYGSESSDEDHDEES
jgi:hypothetical protein